MEELSKILERPLGEWKIKVVSSGTTGEPKVTRHTMNHLTRNIRVSEKRKDDVWGLTYTPSSMAGLQVLFQALFNGNKVVSLSGREPHDICHRIVDERITHLSATPTFYRMLIPVGILMEGVKQVTFGGEVLSPTLIPKLKEIFPNARFTNIYASSEAGVVLRAESDVFTIPEEHQWAYRIKDGELQLHSVITGMDEEWYSTGDMVETVDGGPNQFRIVGRIDRLINVGGQKVRAEEVEEVIIKISGVIMVRVYGKPNSVTGQILCCDISVYDNRIAGLIPKILEDYLPEYKIPRIINVVDEIETTETGKIKRI